MGYDGSGSFWSWREGIGHVTGAIYLEDGAMFYEVTASDGQLLEALQEELERL
jgi:hypothetical protein|tara:strand:- start:1323 stop:1481 length:159 start_codon:yes stop_codon:yes gene_type:complete